MLDEMSVAEYLASNPDFFSQHTELLANMYVPAQNGAGTISLVERQQQAQRDKIRQLEANYSNLLRIGNQMTQFLRNYIFLPLSYSPLRTLKHVSIQYKIVCRMILMSIPVRFFCKPHQRLNRRTKSTTRLLHG